ADGEILDEQRRRRPIRHRTTVPDEVAGGAPWTSPGPLPGRGSVRRRTAGVPVRVRRQIATYEQITNGETETGKTGRQVEDQDEQADAGRQHRNLRCRTEESGQPDHVKGSEHGARNRP